MEKNLIKKNAKKGIVPSVGAAAGVALTNWPFAVKVAVVCGLPKVALIPIGAFVVSAVWDFLKRKVIRKYIKI